MPPDKTQNTLHAHFDCFSGLSGDMVLGALIDLGVPADWLEAQLKSFCITGFSLKTTRVLRHGIDAVKLDVNIQEILHQRSFDDIQRILDSNTIPQNIAESSLKIFDRIATAESAVHHCPKEQVHFHEIGAVDALVDIVGTCLGLDYLGVREVTASRIPLGTGWIDCDHGKLPVPAPATLEILKDVPVYQTGIPHELTTPTGAAIIASMATGFMGLPAMTVEKIGYGAGTRDLDAVPNLLRIVTGQREADTLREERVCIIECTIDDMNPEIFGHLMERLFYDGALDVIWIPVYMKKNRPGTLIQVICREDRRDVVIRRMLSETTTLGIRHSEMRRRTLPREAVTLETCYGPVLAKRVKSPDGRWRIVPEYEACHKIAVERNLSLKDIYDAVIFAGKGLDDPATINS